MDVRVRTGSVHLTGGDRECPPDVGRPEGMNEMRIEIRVAEAGDLVAAVPGEAEFRPIDIQRVNHGGDA